MPTPTGDCVSIALQHSLSGRKGGVSDDRETELDTLLSAGSKQALTTNIEYELAENQFANSLSAMKTKYLCLSSKPVPKKNGLSLVNTFHNGNGVKNGTTNGITNGSGLNGVKVNPDSVLPQPKFVMFPPENVVLGWKGKVPVGAGLENMGNTCYLNSILQALFHVPALVNWLLSDTEHQKKCEQENGPTCGDCLTCALAKTLISSRSRNVVRPDLITSKLRLICRFLSYGAEEDAHEFMRYLLENVEKGFLKRFSHRKLDPYSRETTPINQIFGGYMRTEVTCRNCGSVSTTFQHFQDLLLDIRKVSKVEEALDQYFSKEVLDGPNAYRCEKCKQVSQAVKKYSIERPPKVLCVQLKRFTGSGSKIMKSIELKIHLSLQKYLNPASQYVSSTPLKYRLIAMVTHSGISASNGHYTAIAETSSSSYYMFDDSSVRPIPPSSVTNTGAYILFFEMELPRTVNGQRENQAVSKATPSTITSNGNSSSNGLVYPSPSLKKWDRVAAVEATTSAPLGNDENGPKKRFVDGTVKVAEEKKNGKVSNSLVPYYDEDSSCSESSLSPSSGPEASQSLTVKATTPHDWQVTVSPAVRNSPSTSSEGSSKINWNVTPRPSPTPRKNNNCSSDTEIDLKNSTTGDSSLSRSASLDRTVGKNGVTEEVPGVVRLPLSPASLLNSGLKEKFKKKADVENENDRTANDRTANDRIANDRTANDSWKERSFANPHNKSRHSYKNDDGSDSHQSNWRNSWNGPNRSNHSFNRNSSSQVTNGTSEKGMSNGVHAQTNKWNKDSSDIVSHLNKMSHTGIGNHILTWNNERSSLDRSAEEERRLARKRKCDDYDEEMDRGRSKKIRYHREFHRPNPFSSHQNRPPQAPHSRNNYHHKHNGYYSKKNHQYNHHIRNNSQKTPFFKRNY